MRPPLPTPPADASAPGQREVTGTDGNDVLEGRDGDDALFGGGGDDVLYANGGADVLFGGAGRDVLNDFSSLDGEDRLYGDAGDDTLNVAAPRVSAFGGDGDDLLAALVSGSTYWGGEGDDHVFLYGGESTAYGGAGNDDFSVTLDSGSAAVSIVGGAGDDTLDLFQDFQSSDGLTLLATGSSGTVASGGRLAATFEGINSFIVFVGEADDEIRVGGGDDSLFVRGGSNTVEAGAGDDFVLVTYGGVNSLDGGDGQDRLVLDVDVEGGNATPVILDAAAGTDAMGSTYAGFETVSATTGAGDDRVTIRGQGDLSLGDGADLGRGGKGANSITGGRGADTLEGLDGDDTLSGEQGHDRLTGGAGADAFVLDAPGAFDTVTDFEHGLDELRIGLGDIRFELGSGPVDPRRFHEGGPQGTKGQFVLKDLGDEDRLYWDADGTGAGKAALIAILSGDPGLDASDLLIV